MQCALTVLCFAAEVAEYVPTKYFPFKFPSDIKYSKNPPELQFEHLFPLVTAPSLILAERELVLFVGFAVEVVPSEVEIRGSFLYYRQMANEH